MDDITKGKVSTSKLEPYIIINNAGLGIADCNYLARSEEDCVSIARHLVRCWNSHEALVEALKGFVDRIDNSNDPRDLVWAKAVAALKLAEESTELRA